MNAKSTLDTYQGRAYYFNPRRLESEGFDFEALPFSLRVLLENAMRHSGKTQGASEAVHSLMDWPSKAGSELPFMPSRVLLQDYTGVPLIVDMAAMRDAAKLHGIDPRRVNSDVPVDLVIDHSVQVDSWGSSNSLRLNLEMEYRRNSERYSLLKWAQSSFSGMRIFPPGKGICHQVNLEYISSVVALRNFPDGLWAVPDTLLGTDSHTTMVNGIGVLGWGVGGIEAEAVMLGEPYHMPIPKVVGVRIVGELAEGATPTDIVLTVTEKLREKGVVGQFVEYFGEGYHKLSAADRATLGNMSPEYGATAGFCPVDSATLEYLRGTGRSLAHVSLVEEVARRAGYFYKAADSAPKYTDVLEIDLSKVVPSIAGPRNPDERVSLSAVPTYIPQILAEHRRTSSSAESRAIADNGYQLSAGEEVSSKAVSQRALEPKGRLEDGSVIIAAITSCTNTSNPTVMVGAALIAKRASEMGLKPKSYVKTSLAPGSRIVTEYLENAGLLTYLEELGFGVVGYGCTTCIGNSGPLPEDVEREIRERDLYCVAVLSGNRNFDGRIHPLARGSFLMSPMLVVAYALAGRIGVDFNSEPLGEFQGKKVYLRDLWPKLSDIKDVVARSLKPELYAQKYADVTEGDAEWNSLRGSTGDTFSWDENSTYIRQPPWFAEKPNDAPITKKALKGARALAVFDDKVTTDHISPAGSIQPDSPAASYLNSHGVSRQDYSTFGSRRGNHEVMVRGGFDNIRLKNQLARGKVGGWTTHFPSGELLTIYDAAMRYSSEGVPLLVLAGKSYGAGSSRDWAAKAPRLLGVRAVIAESFERIHRSNLVAMGVLPLEFMDGKNKEALGLTGEEQYDIEGADNITQIGQVMQVVAHSGSKTVSFRVRSRIDNATELKYYSEGGVLPYVFHRLKRTNNG